MRDRVDWLSEKVASLMPLLTRSVVVSAVFLLAAAVGLREQAQDGNHGQGHAENHDWYKELKQPGTGYSCCNGTMNGVEGDANSSASRR